jgi:hypothetical protein
MTETAPGPCDHDATGCAGQLRNELQIISMVLHLVNPDLSTDPSKIRRIVQHGHSALGRVADILNGCAPQSVSNNPAKLFLMQAEPPTSHPEKQVSHED